MHRLLLFVVFAFAAHSVDAQTARKTLKNEDPAGFIVWNAAKVKEVADRLEKDLGDKPIVFETIGNWEGHSVYLVLRGKTAEAEFHETEEDVYIVHRGHATFILGGEMVQPRKMPRRQERAASITGGTRTDLRPGDFVHVPRAIPHQIVLAPGETFMYLLFKLDEYPLEDLNPHFLTPERPPAR
jgi:mannose-6-phosphate isomerase-like protein (cupin superfamily)